MKKVAGVVILTICGLIVAKEVYETFKFAKAIHRAINKMYEETEKQSMPIREGHDEQGEDQD